MSELSNRRILLIDDMPSIHEDFRKILTPNRVQSAELDEMEAALFGAPAKPRQAMFELDSAYGGEEGLAKLNLALQEQCPYALAFVDMRMPDGWDGAKTIEQLWLQDPQLQVVVCTAYSDYSWDELLDRLHAHDRLLILKKPFDNIEVQQMANTLLTKWQMTERASLQMHHLEHLVDQRTAQFKQASEALQREIDERKQLEGQLVQSENSPRWGNWPPELPTKSTTRSVSFPPTSAPSTVTSSNCWPCSAPITPPGRPWRPSLLRSCNKCASTSKWIFCWRTFRC